LGTHFINFAKRYLEGLRARAITRDSKWGIPLPLENSEGKVFYVWFDAPIGYISASMEWAQKQGDSEAWKKYWCDPKTKYVQFIGKDNIPFHAIFFPAMTMGQNQPYKTVDELSANEFYNLEGKCFSKSEGWYIDLGEFFQKYTADQIRYSIAANAPETSDAEFKWKDFQRHCNSDLLGKYGNLVNRTLTFARKHCESVPKKEDLEEVDEKFLAAISELLGEISQNYEQFRLRRVSEKIMELAQLGNVYFDGKKPWKDAKDPSRYAILCNTVACCLECLKAMAIASYPIIPETAQRVWTMLGYNSRLNALKWNDIAKAPLPVGQVIPKPEILFRKVENEEIEVEIQKLRAMSEKASKNSEKKETIYEPIKEQINYEDFSKLDLRVGKILRATKVPKSKKLLHLTVDLGFEQRSVVAGISQFYQAEELIGKKVVVVANLKATKFMGVNSEGMVLAGSLDKALEVVSVQDLPEGSVVS